MQQLKPANNGYGFSWIPQEKITYKGLEPVVQLRMFMVCDNATQTEDYDVVCPALIIQRLDGEKSTANRAWLEGGNKIAEYEFVLFDGISFNKLEKLLGVKIPHEANEDDAYMVAVAQLFDQSIKSVTLEDAGDHIKVTIELAAKQKFKAPLVLSTNREWKGDYDDRLRMLVSKYPAPARLQPRNVGFGSSTIDIAKIHYRGIKAKTQLRFFLLAEASHEHPHADLARMSLAIEGVSLEGSANTYTTDESFANAFVDFALFSQYEFEVIEKLLGLHIPDEANTDPKYMFAIADALNKIVQAVNIEAKGDKVSISVKLSPKITWIEIRPWKFDEYDLLPQLLTKA